MKETATLATTHQRASFPLEEYEQHGFCGPLTLLAPTEAATVREDILAAFDGNFPTANNRFKLHLFLPSVLDLARRPLNLIRNLFNNQDVFLWSSDLCVKPHGSAYYFAPHQDATYTGLEPAQSCITCWVALSDLVNVRHGCLQFWPASHRLGQLPHVQEKGDGSNMLSRGQRIAANFAKSDSVPIELQAGQATFHHFYTVHCSGPNNGADYRIGLAFRYIAASVRQTGPCREMVTVLTTTGASRLDDDSESCCFLPEPVLPLSLLPCDVARGRAAHAQAMQREASNYFRNRPDLEQYDHQTTTSSGLDSSRSSSGTNHNENVGREH